MNDTRTDSALFDLCVYAVSSAVGLRDEPKDYGPLRIMEIVERISNHCAGAYGDEFLGKVARKIGEDKTLVMSSPDAFYQRTAELLNELVEERKRRGGGGRHLRD